MVTLVLVRCISHSDIIHHYVTYIIITRMIVLQNNNNIIIATLASELYRTKKIIIRWIEEDQLERILKLGRILKELEYRFYKVFNMPIDITCLVNKIWFDREHEELPNQNKRLSRRKEWSKAADKSRCVRQVTCWWLIALMMGSWMGEE